MTGLIRGRCSAWRHAGVGGKRPPLHVCPGPESSGSHRMYIRPQGGGHLGVDSPVIVGRAMETFKGGSGFPGTTTVWGTAPPPAYGRVVHQGGGVKNIRSSDHVLCHAVQGGGNVVASTIEHLQGGDYVPGHPARPLLARGGGRARSLYATPPSPPPPPRVLTDTGLGTWRQRRPLFFRLAPTAPPFLV